MFVPNVHDCLVLRVESTSKPQEGQARERVWALQVFRTWADLLRLHNQLTASKLRPRQRLAESLTSRLKSPVEGIICKQLAFKILLGSSWLWGRPDMCRPCTARMQTCRELSWPPLYSSSFSEAKPINLRMPSSHQDPMTVQAQISVELRISAARARGSAEVVCSTHSGCKSCNGVKTFRQGAARISVKYGMNKASSNAPILHLGCAFE